MATTFLKLQPLIEFPDPVNPEQYLSEELHVFSGTKYADALATNSIVDDSIVK